MFLKRLFRNLFPKPRKPVSWRSAWPLAVFLLVFALLCFGLEWGDYLLFVRRGRFVFIVAAIWVWWMHLAGYAGLSRARSLLVLFVRLALVGLFVMLLAEPRSVRTQDSLSVIYALDISDSMGEAVESALNFVAETVNQKPEKDQAGLIVFGRNAAVELPPRHSYLFEKINSRIDRDATNLEQALALSAAMLPQDSPGRIVLVTDGTGTEGSLSNVYDDLRARDVAVDVLPLEYNYQDEVWLERLELPHFVKIGENYEAIILLSSLKEGTGRLVLRESGEIIFDQQVSFQPGKNRFVIPIKLREPGYYEYAASIETPRAKDNLQQNNTVMSYIFVEGEGKVLVVTNPQGDERDWKSLAEALKQEKRIVEVRDSYSFPSDSLSLMPYDAVVFVNVPADAFTAVQLQAVEDAVREQGMGYLMVGGPNSFGAGGYHRTPIETALPVTMDVTKKKILPKGALAIILHTCEFAEGNTWAKRITKQAIKVLGEKDEVGVLAYTEKGEDWIFKLTPAGEYEKLVVKINDAQIGDMPSFVNTMQMGLKELIASDAAAKHMIIISDGDPQPPSPGLLQQFINANISISTVAINPHTGQDISGMRGIANLTKGRYYFPQDPNELPSIFIKESKTLKRSMVQNETITPENTGFPSDVLKGLGALPQLKGYVLTTPKPTAELLLRVPLKEEDQIDPILATGKHGLGNTAAFTSDLSPNWGADWVAWQQYRPFLKQLLVRISRVHKREHLRVIAYAAGSEGTVLVEDYHPDESFLQLDARVSGPEERAETIELKQIGPRRYRGTLPLWGRGRYQVMVTPRSGARSEERAHGGFIVPYSPEYLRFRSSPIVLDEIASKTGGQSLVQNKDEQPTRADWIANAIKQIYHTRRQPKQSSQPVFDWFLIALCFLVPADVALRRIQIDLYALKGLLSFGKREGPSTATMGALLDRKKAVADDLKVARKEVPLLQQRPATAAGPRAPVKTPQQPTKPPGKPAAPPAADQETTTARLLEMKRRRAQDKDEGQGPPSPAP